MFACSSRKSFERSGNKLTFLGGGQKSLPNLHRINLVLINAREMLAVWASQCRMHNSPRKDYPARHQLPSKLPSLMRVAACEIIGADRTTTGTTVPMTNATPTPRNSPLS